MRSTETRAISSTLIRGLVVSSAIALLLLVSAIPLKAQANYKVLYSFNGGVDGGQPYAGVVLDKTGNLYGTTQFNGAFGGGTVFELSPSEGGWKFSLVHTFTGGADGSFPIGGVIVDDAGSLYGTASSGGDPACQCGTVFRLSRSTIGWAFKLLHTFTGGEDGASPAASLVFSGNTALAGTTLYGGRYGAGTAFIVLLSGAPDFVSSLNGNNGRQPWASLSGLLGTSYAGGKYGAGNIFELACCGNVRGVHVFNPDKLLGTHPLGNLISDSNGNLYGTTSSGGAGSRGTVYKMTPNPVRADVWAYSVVHSFSGLDGDTSAAGLVLDTNGNLYGTTTFGGADPGYAGTVFKLTPAAKNKWTESLLHSFTGGSDGSSPHGGLVIDGAGALYGTTSFGGVTGNGVVFQITQ